MLKKAMTAAVLGLSLAALPALAQNTTAPANQQPAATTSNTKSDQPHETASSKGMWQASKLEGLDVYNEKNEKIGDIKELMLNKQGQIEMVAIGVGGFLGMGEHDVAVKFTDLKFSDEPVKKSTTTSSNGGGSSTMGAGGGSASSSASSSSSNSPKNYPDHAVLANATKDQLKSMPQFDYNK
jgi:sporulation protein YlmC with PRC-barrel domain